MFDTEPAPDASPLDAAAERRARHLAALKELGEIGMELARSILRQAQAAEARAAEAPAAGAQGEPGAATRADPGLVFSRIARAVRQTLALEAMIAAEDEARAAHRRAEQAQKDEARRATGEWRRSKVLAIVEEAIEVEAEALDRPETVEPRQAALIERLYDPPEDYADRPIGEMVAEICKTLGVTMDWSLWDATPWAIEEARNRTPGSPFANGPVEPLWPWLQQDPPPDPADDAPEDAGWAEPAVRELSG